jgi:acetylornithine deacetylase/succinyl-diaminopimelate desuccinylase-like protein
LKQQAGHPQTVDAADGAAVKHALASPAVARAFAFVDGDGERVTRELVEICEIEAPPFHEQARAEWFVRRFEELGLSEVGRDAEGNVLALRKGARRDPLVVISAHLDTIFPPGTDCRVRRSGARLCAPGIADDSVGLAALLAVARALDAGGVRTEGSVLFLATVGEEGEGDLRGVRYFFSDPSVAASVAAFVSLDGPGVERVTHRALGSRRYAVTLAGPGGHSWGDFGIVNPIHALGRAVTRLASYPVPIEPRTTYNVGHVAGGSSVNTIAQEATMRVDLRSTSSVELARLEAFFKQAVAEAVGEENRLHAPSGTAVEARLELIGDRPSGETPADAPLVRTVVEASHALGLRTQLDCSSTDSNVPISLGVPAVTIGGGGTSANTHSTAEWYDPTGREVGLKRVVLILAALAGLQKC